MDGCLRLSCEVGLTVGESPYFKYSVDKDLKMEDSRSATPDGEVRGSLLISLFRLPSLTHNK